MGDDVSKTLTDAWNAVEASGVPESLYETAFNRALDILVGPPVPQPPITLPPPPPLNPPGGALGGTPPTGGGGHPSGTDEDAFYTKLETVTRVPRTQLESLVHLDEGVPKMAVHTSSLPSSKKLSVQYIARVLLTARYVWLGETEIAVSEVRSEADRYGKADGNFSRHMQELNGNGITISGGSRSQKAKVRQSFVDGLAAFLSSPDSTS